MAGINLGPEAVRQIRALIRDEAGRLKNPDAGHRGRYAGVEEMYVGKPASNIALGDSGTINRWTGEPGSETILTGKTIPDVWAMTHAVTTADFVYVYWVQGYWNCNLRAC